MVTGLRILKIIGWFIVWIFYFLSSVNARSRYLQGESRGMHCYKLQDDSYFIYGSATRSFFDPTRKPFREYTTWKEFWKNKLT